MKTHRVELYQRKNILHSLVKGLEMFQLRRHLRHKLSVSGRALDLGCGTGDYLPLIFELGISHVDALDNNAEMLEMIRDKRVKKIQADIKEINQRVNDTYDLI